MISVLLPEMLLHSLLLFNIADTLCLPLPLQLYADCFPLYSRQQRSVRAVYTSFGNFPRKLAGRTEYIHAVGLAEPGNLLVIAICFDTLEPVLYKDNMKQNEINKHFANTVV